MCIYGSAIERFYDEQGNETEMVVFLNCRDNKKCEILIRQLNFT